MFFLHQLLRLFDDTKMPCFTFIITCSHHFRRKSLNYILIIIKLRGQSPRFKELSPSCFYCNRLIIPRYRKAVVPSTHTAENHDFISSDQGSRSSTSKSLFRSARSGNMPSTGVMHSRFDRSAVAHESAVSAR